MLTIGHSTLAAGIFIRILKENGCRTLVDVRTIPKSRYNPQFAQEALSASLTAADIMYHWAKDLGGLRQPRADSINGGWRNKSFRGYADYMQTPQFAAALDALLALAPEASTAIMCAEAVPWRCHRSLVADALLARGIGVENVMYDKVGASHRKAHVLTPFAVAEGTRVWYPAVEEKTAVPLFASLPER